MEQEYKYKPSWIKIILLVLALIALIVGGYFLVKKFRKTEPTQAYEALVMVTDQKASDPVEDARSSLKSGDVMVVLPEGHQWSDTEKNSYLILKMSLTEEQARNLLAPEEVEREAKAPKERAEPAPTTKATKEGGKKATQVDQREMETVRARAYRLKIETLGFDVQKFWENQVQPYADQIFDWKLMEKKPKVK